MASFAVNVIDLGVLFVILVLALRGYRRGLLREVFTFAGWLGGMAGAYRMMADLAPIAAKAFHLPVVVGSAIAFVGVFLGVFLTCSIAGWLISKIVRATLFAPLDRLGGLSLGAAEAVTLSALVLFGLHASPLFPTLAPRIESSWIGQPLAVRAKALVTALRQTATRKANEAAPSGTPNGKPQAAEHPDDPETPFQIPRPQPPAAERRP